MQPFDQINTKASFPTAFQHINWMHTVVSIGPLLSLAGALYICTYSVGRIAMSMAKDGLLFKYLAAIHPKTKIPHKAILTALVLSLSLTIIIDVESIIGFVNISGFLIYSIIGVSLLVTRYFHDDDTPAEILESEAEIISLLDKTSSTSNLIGEKTNRTRLVINKIRDKCFQYTFFNNKKNALYLIYSIFFINIFFSGLLNNIKRFQVFTTALALVINLILAVVLSLFKQMAMSENVSFQVSLNSDEFFFVKYIFFIIYNLISGSFCSICANIGDHFKQLLVDGL